MAIDRMDWHYESVEELGLPEENAGIHIGMFFTWLIDNDLLGEIHKDDDLALDYVKKIKNRELTGLDFLIDVCDEKFWDDDLNEEANEFVNDYYVEDSEFVNGYAHYFEDYDELFYEYENTYFVENTWANYKKVKKLLDKRFKQWKDFCQR